MKNSTKRALLFFGIGYAVALALLFLSYYLFLPALNMHSVGFWFFLAWGILLGVSPYCIWHIDSDTAKENLKRFGESAKKGGKFVPAKAPPAKKGRPLYLLVLVPIVVLIIGGIGSSRMFHAKTYASAITVTEAVFETDMPKTNKVSHIALMDTETATIIGNRTLGALSDVISQYEVSDAYSQINFRGTPKKVSNLEYAGFFKWIGNSAEGIPGYVMVDPVDNTAEYMEFAEKLRYVESAFFGDDLERRLRFDYPTKIFGGFRFELDEAGDPYYIVPCMEPRAALFGAMDVAEVILFNPCTGVSELLAVADCPAWVDEVYDGYLACEKYDWQGLLSGGFWNSVIGNKDCKQTTDDFGYVILGDDVWYYTGVTSVNSDKSNIGFLLTNARTGAYKFYPVIGAEEHSAMAAAEGEVQEKGYVASFPALINVSGKATYIMVLKDAGGLVKLYALVNVETYSIVATGTTQEKAMEAYNALLVENGILAPPSNDGTTTPPPETPAVQATITVQDVQLATVNGESVAYIRAMCGEVLCAFRTTVSANEGVLLLVAGDSIDVVAYATETARIYTLASFVMTPSAA